MPIVLLIGLTDVYYLVFMDRKTKPI